jgi:hypothetical protein
MSAGHKIPVVLPPVVEHAVEFGTALREGFGNVLQQGTGRALAGLVIEVLVANGCVAKAWSDQFMDCRQAILGLLGRIPYPVEEAQHGRRHLDVDRRGLRTALARGANGVDAPFLDVLREAVGCDETARIVRKAGCRREVAGGAIV